MATTLAAGGEVWCGDETTLREFPPLRAAWAKRGEPAVVVISGRNARRVLHGALNIATGELVHLVRERSRQDDCLAFVEALGQVRPDVPKLLLWDNAPPHHPKRVLAAAEAAHITIAWLPFRAPELMPCEDLWQRLKAVIAANRAYDTVVELAERAVAWLTALLPADRLRLASLLSPKFQWLSTYIAAGSPMRMAVRIFGVDPIEDAFRQVSGALQALGYGTVSMTPQPIISSLKDLRGRLCLLLLLNRSPFLADLPATLLQEVGSAHGAPRGHTYHDALGIALQHLGYLALPDHAAQQGSEARHEAQQLWERAESSPRIARGPVADMSLSPASPQLRGDPVPEGVSPTWAAWCWAWFHQATDLMPHTRQSIFYDLCAAGRWLASAHPQIASPEQWDEEIAWAYVQHICTVEMGANVSSGGRTRLGQKPQPGRRYAPRSIRSKLAAMRRFFTDLQDRPHVVAVSGSTDRLPRKLALRFKPQQVFETPRAIRRMIQPNPRDIDLTLWYKLAYAAASLTEADLLRPRGTPRYPLALYTAIALLWVTSGRRPNELVRLRVDCVRRDWDPAMVDEDGLPLSTTLPTLPLENLGTPMGAPLAGAPNTSTGAEAPTANPDAQLCYLHIPANKTRGPFWIWIPTYTAAAIDAWLGIRPTHQPSLVDPKDGSSAHFLFCFRGQRLRTAFLNKTLIPLLCRVAGVPPADARGAITPHRGRSTRATILRRLGLWLGEIAEYLGHTNTRTVTSYARTDPIQFAQTLKRANALERVVEGLLDLRAAQERRPNVFFFLGSGPDGKSRYCANPLWSRCPHRLACLKCSMHVGGTAAELLAARDGILRFQAQMPMNTEEKAACDGDAARLNARLEELRRLPPPEPPGPDFVFNPTFGSPPTAVSSLEVPPAVTDGAVAREHSEQDPAPVPHVALSSVQEAGASRPVADSLTVGLPSSLAPPPTRAMLEQRLTTLQMEREHLTRERGSRHVLVRALRQQIEQVQQALSACLDPSSPA